MSNYYKLLFITTVIVITSPLFANASGLSVSPSSLEFIPTSIKQAENKTVTVHNPTGELQNIEIDAGALKTWLIIEPKTFTLKPGEQRTVDIKLILPLKPGNINKNGNLSIVATGAK